jgi:phosphoesterase RecJ-like protein
MAGAHERRPSAEAAAADAPAAGPREGVLERIQQDQSFVVATHENPDGDAIGSLIATHGLLRALGKDVVMFMAESDLPLPPEYRLFALEDLIHTVPTDIGRRTVIALDCGNIDRSPAGALDAGAHLVNIDHHHDNTHFGTIDYVVPDASCTAEIVWRLMGDLQVEPTPMMAEAMYVALVTDTGRFMYENTGAEAHRMAAYLIGAGVDVNAVYRRLYEESPFAKLRLLALALANVKRFDDGELTLAVLSAGDFAEAEAEQTYSEGIIDHLRSVQGTRVAALVRELTDRPGRHKISLRATDEAVDVSVIARAKGGGGHPRAAGFSSEESVDEVIAFLRGEIAAQLHQGAGSGAPERVA